MAHGTHSLSYLCKNPIMLDACLGNYEGLPTSRCETNVFYEVLTTPRCETIVFYGALATPSGETIVFYEAS